MPKSSNKNLNVKLDDFIDDNDISTYGVAIMENFNNLGVVIATHWNTEIIFFIRKIIPK